MSKNIEMQINTGNNTYEVLYPKTLGSLIDGAVNSAINATSAETLSNTLSVSKGGTGVTSLSSLASSLSSYISSGCKYKIISVTGTNSGTSSSEFTVQTNLGTYPALLLINIDANQSTLKDDSTLYYSFFMAIFGDSTSKKPWYWGGLSSTSKLTQSLIYITPGINSIQVKGYPPIHMSGITYNYMFFYN